MKQKTVLPILLGLLIATTITLSKTPPTYAAESEKLTVRILYVILNPVEDGQNLAAKFFGGAWPGLTPEQLEDRIANDTIASFKEISNGMIDYQIAKEVPLATFPTYKNGFQFNFQNYAPCTIYPAASYCEEQKKQFDTVAWVRDNQICQTAAEVKADEIWLLTGPFITTYEAFMIGPEKNFWVNGPGFDIPECQKQYVVMNVNYNTPKNFLHNYGHRFEATMDYLTSSWQNSDETKYWSDFSNPSSQVYCGNTHFPPNAERAYDCANHTNKESRCPDWPNFPDFTGARETVNCNAWNCNDNDWQEYWFKAIPKNPGQVVMMDIHGGNFAFKKNWWFYLLYPENAISFRFPKAEDINRDGQVNTRDIKSILNDTYIEPLYLSDYNLDGQINTFDFGLLATKIQ